MQKKKNDNSECGAFRLDVCIKMIIKSVKFAWLFDKGQDLLIERKYVDAYSVLCRAYDSLSASKISASRFYDIDIFLAECCSKLGKVDEAESFFERAFDKIDRAKFLNIDEKTYLHLYCAIIAGDIDLPEFNRSNLKLVDKSIIAKFPLNF